MVISKVQIDIPAVDCEQWRVTWRESVDEARIELKRLMHGELVPVILHGDSYREREETFDDCEDATKFAELLQSMSEHQ